MASPDTDSPIVDPRARDFYRAAMDALRAAEVPFLVGGSFSLVSYTGLARHSKDFDIFVRPADFDAALQALSEAGYRVERTFPHWLGKAFHGDDFVDVIFSSGNGLARVDDEWFAYATLAEVFGLEVSICPAEESLWSKAFIMERERFDGADVAHLLLSRVESLDWTRLLGRFGDHWQVLLAQLLLFSYIYPSEAKRIPPHVLDELTARLAATRRGSAAIAPVCRGTLLSRAQYLVDVESLGFLDARLAPIGAMSLEEVEVWTAAIAESPADAAAPVLARIAH
jgi:hypothetical protein